jgi:hypothetical protein
MFLDGLFALSLVGSFAITFAHFAAYTEQLSHYDLDKGWFNDRLKDTTDVEWSLFSRHAIQSIPWLIIHFIGSQYLKKFNKGVSYRNFEGVINILHTLGSR